jgi:hypothetical protein
MGGVSITESGGGGYDAAAILSGGAEFLARLQAFKDAKDAADQAYERLGIGQNVASEMDKAARMTADAKAEAESIVNQALQDAASRQKNLAEFVAQTRDAAAADRQDAARMKAEAEQDRAAAAAILADAAAQKAANDEKAASLDAAQKAFNAASAALSKVAL